MTQVVGSNVRGLSLSADSETLVAFLVRNQADIFVGHLNSEGTRFDEEIRLTEDDEPREPWVFEIADDGRAARMVEHSSYWNRIE